MNEEIGQRALFWMAFGCAVLLPCLHAPAQVSLDWSAGIPEVPGAFAPDWMEVSRDESSRASSSLPSRTVEADSGLPGYVHHAVNQRYRNALRSIEASRSQQSFAISGAPFQANSAAPNKAGNQARGQESETPIRGSDTRQDAELLPTPPALPRTKSKLGPFSQPQTELRTDPFDATRADSETTSNPILRAPEYKGKPEFFVPEMSSRSHSDALTRHVTYQSNAFLPPPRLPHASTPQQEFNIYRGKFPVPTQRPLLELGRPLYTTGLYPPAKEWLGRYNPVMPHFMVYGDFRTGAAINRNTTGDFNNLAVRANLDMDLEITATERLHAFIGPFDRTGDFTHIDFTEGAEFVDRTDLRFDTLFFEGDAGAIFGGLTDQDAPFDLPFTFGFLPFFYQNGIWAADNAMGAAFALPSRHSSSLSWSNFDATFFWASDQINSDAFPGDNNAAEFFGTAWFIDAYDGYIEVDYAFVHDDAGEHRSYHNFSAAFTRRYFHRVSNSIRLITNFNQSLPRAQRTAEGHLILIENAWISPMPNTFVPYFNIFYGQGRTQSLARAGVFGGILNNTGINFETDGLTGYPTLDATAVNTTGAALGVNILGCNFNQQLILEFAALAANGSRQFRNAAGDQYALGMRYQRPLSNAWIFRTDHMFGFLRGTDDIRGSRIEFRWKF